MQPIIQFAEPGGFWMTKSFASQFHATPQPIVQPWPEPIEPRLRKSMPPLGHAAVVIQHSGTPALVRLRATLAMKRAVEQHNRPGLPAASACVPNVVPSG